MPNICILGYISWRLIGRSMGCGVWLLYLLCQHLALRDSVTVNSEELMLPNHMCFLPTDILQLYYLEQEKICLRY